MNDWPCVTMKSSYEGGLDDLVCHALTVASRDAEMMDDDDAKATSRTCRNPCILVREEKHEPGME